MMPGWRVEEVKEKDVGVFVGVINGPSMTRLVKSDSDCCGVRSHGAGAEYCGSTTFVRV